MILNLVRDLAGPDYTSGVLTSRGGLKLYTIERPWIPDPICRSGVKYRSCVSEGAYKLVPHPSEKFGNVWALENPAVDVYHYPYDIPSGRDPETVRTAILIHAGNWAHDMIGCIAPGMSRIPIENGYMVQQSRVAITTLLVLESASRAGISVLAMRKPNFRPT